MKYLQASHVSMRILRPRNSLQHYGLVRLLRCRRLTDLRDCALQVRLLLHDAAWWE